MLRRRFLIGSLALLGSGATCRWATRNRLTVTNESGQVVRDLTVGVGGEMLRFGDLVPDASASAHFRIGHEESFEVRCRLVDGTEIHESEGYLVWADDLFGVAVALTIRADGVLQFSR